MQSYLRTKYKAGPVIDLSDPTERGSLSKGALRTFFNIIVHWKVKDEDAQNLLGGVRDDTYCDYKKNQNRVLDQDRITRISYLAGIFGALNSLHGEELADKWVTLSNSNRIFGGRTPLDYMIRGGIPAMQTVRRLLDARSMGP